MIYDALVIGAGQAGLSLGYYLKKTSLSFLLLDEHSRIGESWRKRYDSLVLFTPKSYSSLPGMGVEGCPSQFPTKEEIAMYLESYATHYQLPIQLNTQVKKLTKEMDLFVVETNASTLRARNVIVCTGPFHTPSIPSIAKTLSTTINQMHSSEYRNPSQLASGSVLVVGGGNSGAQIAIEIANQGYDTYLSVSKSLTHLPLTIANKSIFWWLDRTKILRANKNTLVGKAFRKRGNVIFGTELNDAVAEGKITIKKRSVGATDQTILFADQTTLNPDNIIWATGYTPDYSWIDMPNIIQEKEWPLHERGVTSIKGLFFLGMPWQSQRGSALLLGVGSDAGFIHQKILENN